MQTLPLVLGGLGCLLLLAVLWKPPSVQDEDLRASETDTDCEAPSDPTDFDSF